MLIFFVYLVLSIQLQAKEQGDQILGENRPTLESRLNISELKMPKYLPALNF